MANVITQLRPGVYGKVQDEIFDISTLATADILYAFTILPGQRVKNVDSEVVVATGETCVIEIGVYSNLTGSAVDADGFEASADVNAAVGTQYTGKAADALVADGGWLNTTGANAYIGVVPTVSASPLGALGTIRLVASMSDELNNPTPAL